MQKLRKSEFLDKLKEAVVWLHFSDYWQRREAASDAIRNFALLQGVERDDPKPIEKILVELYNSGEKKSVTGVLSTMILAERAWEYYETLPQSVEVAQT